MVRPEHYDSHPVAPWIIPRLNYARAHGWTGRVISGYRTDAEQIAAGTQFARQLGKPVSEVYPNGLTASAHCGLIFPRGAIDVTDPAGMVAAMAKWRAAGRAHPLIGGGQVLPFDRAHFSSNGH